MPPPGTKVIATNRQARRDYEIIDTLECGIALKGSEVKSLRDAHVQFADANGWIRDGELWLIGLHIAPYSHSSGVFGHDPDRERKLLVHRDEIDRLRSPGRSGTPRADPAVAVLQGRASQGRDGSRQGPPPVRQAPTDWPSETRSSRPGGRWRRPGGARVATTVEHR